MRKLFLLSLALMASFATCAWADAAYGFENNATSESGYPTSAGDGERSISSSISRTGSYSLEQNNKNTSDKVVKLQNMSATFKGGKHYIHSIAYIRKNTSNNATLKGYSFYAGSEFGSQTASTALSSDWTRVVNKGQRTGNTQDYTSVELRYKTNTATSGDKVYLDDIIVYVTEGNDKTDLKKPGSATEPEATAVEISWTNGEDQSDSNNGATGIQNTLIWKRTSGSENDLTLNDQGVYSLTAKEGPSTDQSGHWTLVTASVAAGTAGETSSYSGTFTPGDVYAIVHRDLAYNYSTPTYVTIPAATAYDATFANGGHGAAPSKAVGVYFVVLEEITGVDGWTHTGWKADVATQKGTTDIPANTLIENGETIVLLENTTFTAQWEEDACPSGITISGENEYSERTDIELTASLTEGNGEITYNWYKGDDLAAAIEAGSIGTGTTYSKASCAKSDAGNYFCVATKATCSETASEAFEVTITDYVCPTSGVLFALTMKDNLANQSLDANTEMALTTDYATILNGSAILRNNDGSDGKAKINESHIYFNGGKAYVKVEMTCGPLASGDTIAFTSTNYENELWLTNTNSNSEHIETSGRKHVVVKDDLLDGKSVFYVWRKSGATYVKTMKVIRPAGSATSIENQESKIDNRKFIKDGQLFIEKNGHVYNVFGACIK